MTRIILAVVLIATAGLLVAAPTGVDFTALPTDFPIVSRSWDSDSGLEPDFMEKLFGPTDIHGAVGNGRLAAGVNADGTITVLKWPRPSFHDQVRYFTRSRDLPLLGARENDGVFFGLFFTDPKRCVWLRYAERIEQKYLDDFANVLVTTYHLEALGLEVRVVDFAVTDADALVRRVSVLPTDDGAELPAALVAFANLSLCQVKLPFAPVADWLFDALRRDELVFDQTDHLLVQVGTSDQPRADPVAAAMGFWEASIGHQCGLDGAGDVGGEEAYSDACDGTLTGASAAAGEADAALAAPLFFGAAEEAGATFFIHFATDAEKARKAARRLRLRTPNDLLTGSVAQSRDWLLPACLPDTDDEDILTLARRALLLTRVVRDERSGALGCSVATQPPYALDWARDGTYMNLMLAEAGYFDLVTEHNRFYAAVQRRPLGNWDMCVYGDGVPGGPLFLELDTLGLTAWNLWRHFQVMPPADADEYLDEVYEAIARAADFFVAWRDPQTGLPLPAWESDFPAITSTLLSACMAWLSLRSAVEAGDVMGELPSRVDDWQNRQDELTQAIFEYYFNEDGRFFIGDPLTQAYMIYPVEFLPVDDPRMQNTAEKVYDEWLEPILAGETAGGSYLGLASIALARAWQGQPDKLVRVEGALDFIVHELPTEGTHHYGECFVTLEGGFETRTGIPHPMTAALTYLTAAEIYGVQCPPAATDDDSDGDDDAAGDDDLADDDTSDADDDVAADDDDDDDSGDDASGCGC